MKKNGLLIVYTGNGKGKTTAALGQALRAAGHGLKVCIIQFIKRKTDTGEVKMINALPDLIEIHPTGSGFTWEAKDLHEVTQAAKAGWRLAKTKIESDCYDLIILDELTYLLNRKVLDEAEVLSLCRHRPARLHLIITGRYADQELIATADLVTEMKEIKHPFHKGVKAQKGMEF